MLRSLVKRVTKNKLHQTISCNEKHKLLETIDGLGIKQCEILNGFFQISKRSDDGLGLNSVTFFQRQLAIPPGVSPGANRLVHPNNQKRSIARVAWCVMIFCVLALNWFNFNLCYVHWSNVLLKLNFIKLFRVMTNKHKLLQTIDGLGIKQCVTGNKW